MKSKKNKLKEIVKHLSNKHIRDLSSASYNILKGVLELSDRELSQAKKFKHLYKRLSSKKIKLSDKRAILVDNTQFLKSLMKLVLKTFD